MPRSSASGAEATSPWASDVRRIKIGALVAATAALVASCGSDTAPPEAAPDPTPTSASATTTAATTAAATLSPSDVVHYCRKDFIAELDANNIDHNDVVISEGDIDTRDLISDSYFGLIPATVKTNAGPYEVQMSCEIDAQGNLVTSELVGVVSMPEQALTSAPPTTAPQPHQQVNQAPVDKDRTDNLGVYYHNFPDYRWLSNPGKIVPGGLMYRIKSNGEPYSCSMGWMAYRDDTAYIVTAGHCGEPGDVMYIPSPNGGIEIGHVVVSQYDRFASGEFSRDHGLIEITQPSLVDPYLPTGEEIKGWRTPEWAEQNGYAVCKLGATFGYSCGEFISMERDGQFSFRGYGERGDSGGPVWARTPEGDAYAIGVFSNLNDYAKIGLGAMSITEVMEGAGLTLWAYNN